MANIRRHEQIPARVQERIDELLDDARLARRTGDWKLAQSLVNAVLALEPDNPAAGELLAGPAARRQMTLLFCDIVGSTQIADARDPEETTFLLRSYRSTCAQVVERFGGFIDDHRGDGMLVLFGFPQVHEDDARRAVHCGLAMIEALSERVRMTGTDWGEVSLAVRIAVHTDLVVIDGVGVAGATANETARIQDFAQPDTVVISDATKALVAPWFDTASLGEVELRGVARPVEIFTVRGAHLSRTVPASPFVGRQRERAELASFISFGGLSGPDGAVEPARAVIITGPAGVGKTRLVLETALSSGIRTYECGCSGFHRDTSLQPFRGIIAIACGIGDDDGVQLRLEKLRAHLDPQLPVAGDLPFLAAVLDIPLTMLLPPAAVDPSQLRALAMLEAARLVGSVAESGTALILVDDVHWADPASLELLSLIMAAPHSALSLVLTAREDFQAPWPTALAPGIRLDPLNHRAMEELAAAVPEGSGLAEEDRQLLIERSDGIPLFLEELLRTAEDVGNGRILHRSVRFGGFKIPPALLDPLLARLASPSVDLELAQLAATIGREVERDLLAHVVGGDPDEFDNRLETLFASQLLESSDGTGVRFRHEMIREVAYESQKRSTLRANHSHIADRLREWTPVMTPRYSSELALHLENAHRYVEAIAAHLDVAAADQAVGSHLEATARLTHTLDLLDHVPKGPQSQQTELTVREMRSFSAVMAGGYAAPEAAEDYPRCVTLCQGRVAGSVIVPSLIRSWSYYAFRGNLSEAESVTVALVRHTAEAGLAFPAREVGEGIGDFFSGRFDQSRQLLEQFTTSNWAATDERPPQEWPLPNDPLAAVCAHLVPLLWIKGQPAAAEQWADRARDRATSLLFPYGPFSVCYVDSMLALTRNMQGDHAGAAEIGLELIELGERHGFAMWRLVGALQVSISSVRLGQHETVDQLTDLVSMWRTLVAADAWTPYWLTELALAQKSAGRLAESELSLQQATSVAAETGSAFYSAETLRVRGQLLLAAGSTAAAGRCFRQAIDLAHRQGAVVFERRAATCLAEAEAG